MAHIPKRFYEGVALSHNGLQWDPENPRLGVAGKDGIPFKKRVKIGCAYKYKVFCRLCKHVILAPIPVDVCCVCRKKNEFKRIKRKVFKECEMKVVFKRKTYKYNRGKMCKKFGSEHFPLTSEGVFSFTKNRFVKDGVVYWIDSVNQEISPSPV